MFDYRGNPPHAKLILLPDQAQVGRLVKPNIVYEQPMIPFTGLTTDMRGRDLLGYAICKDFQQIPAKSNLTQRLVNPVQHREQYPQRKPKTKSGYVPDIRPSELDMLGKISNDNTKMLIIKLLQAKSIGQETLRKGTPQQQAKLQIAYDDLRNRYEQVYRDYKGLDVEVELTKLLEPFKKSVTEIYGITLEELNRLNKDIPVQQEALAVAVDADGKKDETRVPSTTPLDPNALLTTDQSNILKTVQEQARKLAEAEARSKSEQESKVKEDLKRQDSDQKFMETETRKEFDPNLIRELIENVGTRILALNEIHIGIKPTDPTNIKNVNKMIYDAFPANKNRNYDTYDDLIQFISQEPSETARQHLVLLKTWAGDLDSKIKEKQDQYAIVYPQVESGINNVFAIMKATSDDLGNPVQ